MQSSEQINELATALSKAQGEITGALKDSANPFFKSKYADLASCWDAARGPLSKNGLSVTQFPSTLGSDTLLITRLMHSSGQWLQDAMIVKCKDDTSQAQGSGLTYARRYAFAAVIGVAQIDDDGNAASGRASTVSDIKGDLGASIAPSVARAEAGKVRTLLALDVEHRIKALKAFDLHEVLNRDPDLYTAVGDELTAKERADFKAYVKEAKELEKEDRAVSNVGKRF